MKIGLTDPGMKEEKYEAYVQWLKDKDPAIRVVKLDAGPGLDIGMIKDCDGLVLSGGVDVHPGFYHGSSDYRKAPQTWQRDRDDFERALFGYALEHRLPVIGICRGLQLINVLLGGSLIQDLGQEGNETHEAVPADKWHDVYIGHDGLLGEITSAKKGVVNSAHHQAIDRLGEGLSISCKADDGTIEGIEWSDPVGKSFLLGVQWHPERMYTDAKGDPFFYQPLRDRFVKEMAKGKSH